MSDPIQGRLTESPKWKSPPVVAEEKETPGAPKRIKLSLRAVVQALSKWRMDAEALGFSDEGAQKKGGSADVAKATASIVNFVGPDDDSSVTTHDVAVKKFRLSGGGDINGRAQAAAFANELSLLSELLHDNIVQLIGFVERAEEDIAWILLRWEENGNIREFVHSQDWVITERLGLIYDVACGVKYLHSRDPPICHGDLKSLNILVNSQNHAVITDFGSARRLESHPRPEQENNVAGPAARDEPTTSQVQEQGLSLVQIEECGTFLTLTGPAYTLRWAAPEVLRDCECGLAGDMWAFAWVCWEIMTGNVPFENLQKESVIIVNVIRGNLPPVTSNEHVSQIHVLCAMMTRCWRMEPTTRPAARDCESSIRVMDRITPTRRHYASELETYSVDILCSLGYTKYENLQDKEAKEYFVRAVKVAESAGDALGAARAMVGQGTVCRELHEYAEAETLYTAARETFKRHGAEKQATDATWGLGEVYRKRNEYSKAEAAYIEVREICAALGAERDVAHAAWGLGDVYQSRNEYSKAEASYNEAREIYARLGAEHKVADALWLLGQLYRLQNDYFKSETSFIEAKEIYARLGDEEKVADALWGLGAVYWLRNEYSEAEASDTEAKEIYARLGAEKKVADAISGLAAVYKSRNEYSKAEASYIEAREIYARLGGEEKLVAEATTGLGHVYRWRNEYSKAEASYTEAREIYARLGAEKEVADTIWALGETYRWRNEYSKAEASYTEAKEIYARMGAEQKVAEAIWGLGEVYRWRNEYSKAEASYTEAREIYARLGAEKDVAFAILGLGNVYRRRNEYSKAEASYTEAKEIFARLGAEQNVADAILGLGGVYRSRKEYRKAKAAFIEAREIFTKTGYQEGVEDALAFLAKLPEQEGSSTGAEGSLRAESVEAEEEA